MTSRKIPMPQIPMPQIPMRQIPMRQIPVLEIGGTHVTAALVATDGWRVVDGSVARTSLDADGTVDDIVLTLTRAAVELGVVDRSMWGVAIPGPFDYERGIGDFRGVGKFDALRGVDLGKLLRQRIAAPSGRVAFVNDADAFGIGEWVAGAARGHRRVVGVTLGTGIGSAFLVDGEPQVDGPGVPPDGRIHHLKVRGRPLEERVSRQAIRSLYGMRRPMRTGLLPDVREIAELASAGDEVAAQALTEPLARLGRLLGPRAVAFGATVVVVGGSIALAGDLVLDALRAGMDSAAPRRRDALDVVRARWIEEAPLIGAARRAVGGERRAVGGEPGTYGS